MVRLRVPARFARHDPQRPIHLAGGEILCDESAPLFNSGRHANRGKAVVDVPPEEPWMPGRHVGPLDEFVN